MSEKSDNLNPHQMLMALADGELDPAAKLEALRHITTDPQAASLVQQQLQLRSAVKRAVSAEPPPSDDLVNAVSALAFQMSPDTSALSGDTRPSTAAMISPLSPGVAGGNSIGRRRGPIRVAAAIGLLAAGILLGRLSVGDRSKPVAITPETTNPSATVDVVPARFVSAATEVHVRCSRAAKHDYGQWPQTLVSIEEPFKKYVGNSDQAYPDLSGIGFTYVGCGPCGRPEQHGVHLLYRSTTGTDTLSLFVEPYKKQIDLPVGQCHYASGSEIHPVLTWRTDELVFILVGNARIPVEKAREALRLPTPI